MWKFWQRMREAKGFTLASDPYGYSVHERPSFFLRSAFERFITKTSMPEDQQKLVESLAQQGTVVYAAEYRSQFDFIYLSLRLHQLGLPKPTFLFDLHPYFWQPRIYAAKLMAYHLYRYLRMEGLPDPYADGYYQRKIQEGQSGLLFLVGKRGYYERAIRVGNDPLEHLVDVQSQMDKPIFVVPLVLLYSRSPDRERKGLQQVFRGPRERASVLRKWWRLAQGPSLTVLEAGEALNLQEVAPELSPHLSERRKQVFQLRRELIDSVDKIKRAIVGPTLKSKLELKEIILHHPRLETFMQRRARSTKQEIWKIRAEADQYLEEIAADYNYTLIRFGESVLKWMWTNLFDGVEVDMESLARVKNVSRHNTIVYIPCHKSHIDYLILSFILFDNSMYTPFIAAGKNLAFWPLGPIFRRGGAFFIRRSFKGLKFYAEVFSLYVKTMVQLGHNIEFFIEGGRSRTGKMVLPKLGLLAILLQAVEEGFCDDLVFVPTSICYDRIPEEDAYAKEVSGGAKVDENIGQLVRARRFLKKRYGRVYVQFAEPMSYQRYIERRNLDLKKLRPRDRHAMYRDFAYRIINSINQASLVTPHALVASALLSASRGGVSMGEFHEVCRQFHDFLTDRGIGLSKTFRSYDLAVAETLSDFERSKVIGKLKDEDDDLEEEVYTIDDGKRLTLEYYKNNIIHFLLPAAYVATSILAQQTFRFSVAQILEDVAFMKSFFKYEFVFDNELGDEDLIAGVLQIFERRDWLHRLGENDQPFILSHNGHRAANAFHGLLRSYFEGYWLVLRAFRYLQKKPCTEKDFMKKVFNLGQKTLKLDLIERPESVSKIMFGNALNYYLERGLIEKKVEEDKGKEKGQEYFADTGDRLLIQDYSRQISRFLRSPRFTLQ
ncbi:MAG: 1-acyl-sn-glycerol-3-phosphate acyltransferase [Syntrophobacteraceae bacterium]|jgi:glycerol-3-phosphate O-acyltransferase|nr:1-acyl-sn-glycerol-3-phosphate acyltransferase [Syntrophobacteraceae bacterium]